MADKKYSYVADLLRHVANYRDMDRDDVEAPDFYLVSTGNYSERFIEGPFRPIDIGWGQEGDVDEIYIRNPDGPQGDTEIDGEMLSGFFEVEKGSKATFSFHPGK